MKLTVYSPEPLYGEALASLLSHEGKFDVVAQVSSSRTCLMSTKEHRAQLVVIAGTGLSSNDIEFLMGARAYGEFGIVLVGGSTSYEAEDNILDATLGSSTDAQTLFRTIREIGGAFVRTPGTRIRERRQNYGAGIELTRREYEVATLVSKGFSNRRIAEVTGLQEQSIKNLVSVIMRKLKCENRVQVALRLTSAAVLETESR